MELLGESHLRNFVRIHPESSKALVRWAKIVRRSNWGNPADLRRVMPSADFVKITPESRVTIFNLGGSKYRLIAEVLYESQRLFVIKVMTHAEYSKGRWKAEVR